MRLRIKGTLVHASQTLGAEKMGLQLAVTLTPSSGLRLPQAGGESWTVDGRGLIPSFRWQEAPSPALAGVRWLHPGERASFRALRVGGAPRTQCSHHVNGLWTPLSYEAPRRAPHRPAHVPEESFCLDSVGFPEQREPVLPQALRVPCPLG